MKGTFQDVLNSAELVIEAKSSEEREVGGGRDKKRDRDSHWGRRKNRQKQGKRNNST